MCVGTVVNLGALRAPAIVGEVRWEKPLAPRSSKGDSRHDVYTRVPMIVPKPKFKRAALPLLLFFFAIPQTVIAQEVAQLAPESSDPPETAGASVASEPLAAEASVEPSEPPAAEQAIAEPEPTAESEPTAELAEPSVVEPVIEPPAQSEDAEQKPASEGKEAQLFGGRRWAFGIIGGYYAPTSDIYDLKVDPLGATVGLTASWTMQNGVWFGIQGQYFPGSTVSQTYRVPLSTTDLDVDADTQLTSFGASVGYDHPVGSVVVRFALEVGASLVAWDLGDQPYLALSGYSPIQGFGVTPYLAPGMGVVIPFGGFFLAPEFRYRLELGSHAPSALGGQLHTGWRF